MTLRDQHGEIEVRIGDLFTVKTGPNGQFLAILEALIPDRDGSSRPIVCCRIHEGQLFWEGKMGNPGDLLNCTSEVVASGVRSYRGNGLGSPVPVPIRERKPVTETRRARETVNRQRSDQTTNQTGLFD